jgi:hypothetical protein
MRSFRASHKPTGDANSLSTAQILWTKQRGPQIDSSPARLARQLERPVGVSLRSMGLCTAPRDVVKATSKLNR